MPCEISDIVGYRNSAGTLVGVANLPVIAVPESFRSTFDYAGDWHPTTVNNPLIVGNPALSHGQITTTNVSGAWSHSLPYASTETHPASPEQKWSLLFPDGQILSGYVPAVAGPLSVDDLVETYGWGWASSVYVAPVTAGVFAKGTVLFTGASATVSVLFASPFASNAYQIFIGSSVDDTTAEPMQVSWTNKTTTGFDLVAKDAAYVGSVDWSAHL